MGQLDLAGRGQSAPLAPDLRRRLRSRAFGRRLDRLARRLARGDIHSFEEVGRRLGIPLSAVPLVARRMVADFGLAVLPGALP